MQRGVNHSEPYSTKCVGQSSNPRIERNMHMCMYVYIYIVSIYRHIMLHSILKHHQETGSPPAIPNSAFSIGWPQFSIIKSCSKVQGGSNVDF